MRPVSSGRPAKTEENFKRLSVTLAVDLRPFMTIGRMK
ncbi:hypothetical protein EKH55_3922 [Sinorhizobium alkalisoli]|nr:hypothetical protein EKH55_3922 [Sinorhizobium alkalisoli]